MKNSFDNRKKAVKRISALAAVLLLAVSTLSLSSCALIGLTASVGEIIGGTYGEDIKLNQTPVQTEPAVTTYDNIQILDPGLLDIYNDPTVRDNQTDFTETVASVEKSVVEIETESASYGWSGQYIQQGAGSGVIIAHNDDRSVYYIVTNHHVIDSAESILVRLSDGTEYQKAKLIATDMLTDVALLAISTPEGTELTTAVFMNEASTLANGQDIFVIGNPLGELGGSVTKGIVSKTERLINVDGIAMRLLQIDASVNPGNSGGALFDMFGNLVGIVNAKYTDESVEGIGFAIPINTVRAVVQELAQNGYVSGRPGLGFDTADKSYSSGSMFGSSTTYPTVIADTSVTGSYTDEDGKTGDLTFMKDDIILAVGETKVTSTAGLLSRLASHKIGDTVTLTVQRTVTVTQNGRVYYTYEQYKVSVTLVEYVPTAAAVAA